jgi:hypothetical protein
MHPYNLVVDGILLIYSRKLSNQRAEIDKIGRYIFVSATDFHPISLVKPPGFNSGLLLATVILKTPLLTAALPYPEKLSCPAASSATDCTKRRWTRKYHIHDDTGYKGD